MAFVAFVASNDQKIAPKPDSPNPLVIPAIRRRGKMARNGAKWPAKLKFSTSPSTATKLNEVNPIWIL